MRTERNWGSRTGAKRPFWKKGAIIHHLKVVHCVLPKAPCRELMISAVCSNHTGEATLPLRWLCQLPLCGLAAGKRLQSELKRLTRSGRTHRLCTRAGMLETFLKEPTTLTDDDVMELLTFIFHSEAIQKKLDLLIENRKETEQPNGS